MKINAHICPVPSEITDNARVIFCESCKAELADMIFQYEFSDGTAFVAQVCNRCYLAIETDDLLVIKLLDNEISRLDYEIESLEDATRILKLEIEKMDNEL